MSEAARLLTEHPFAAVAVCFVLLLVLYFSCKRLIKLALVALVIALVIGGYYYFQGPGQRPADMKEALEKARTDTGRAVEKGKEFVEKGREIIGKGKNAVEKGKEALDRSVDKGKDVVAKGKRAAREIGKIFGGENEDGEK